MQIRTPPTVYPYRLLTHRFTWKNERSWKRGTIKKFFDFLYAAVTQCGRGHNKRSRPRRSGFVKISRAFTRHKTMLFPSSLISFQRTANPPAFVPRPAIRFSLHEGPRVDHLRDICRVSRRAFQRGMSQQRALHESRAMQWPHQVHRLNAPVPTAVLPTIKRRMIIFTGAA